MEGRGVLGRRQLRSVYLVTYSQANSEIVDSRESFVLIVLDSFENADPKCRSQVKQWVCSEELHKDGGKHYHMVVKLDRSRRWLQVRDYADNKHGVKLNFSSTRQLLFLLEICNKRGQKLFAIGQSSRFAKCTANPRGE